MRLLYSGSFLYCANYCMKYCIYSINDNFGRFDDEKVFLLQAFRECEYKIIIVSSTEYSGEDVEKARNISDELYMRVGGFNANRWKYALEILMRSPEWQEVDDLILMDDTFFGPLVSFAEVLEKMKEYDVWGLTAHQRYVYRRNIIGKFGIKCAPKDRFIQTYFLKFGKRALHSERFRNFFLTRKPYKRLFFYERDFEFILTEYFSREFSVGVYADTQEWESENPEAYYAPLIVREYDLIVKKNFPIIAKTAVTLEKSVQLLHDEGEQREKALVYIENNTDYDMRLIRDYLLLRYTTAELYQALNLNYIIKG